MGSTFAENVSYPDNPKFDVLDMGEGEKGLRSYRALWMTNVTQNQ